MNFSTKHDSTFLSDCRILWKFLDIRLFILGLMRRVIFFFPFPREESAFFHFSPLHLSRNILVPVDLANRSTELIDTFTR